jgi:hypothetical protein
MTLLFAEPSRHYQDKLSMCVAVQSLLQADQRIWHPQPA